MRKLGYLVMPIMAISLLASCGGTKPDPGPEPTPETYDVTCSDGYVTIANPKATKGEKYTTRLTTEEKLILPNNSNEVAVTIAGESSENFDYSYIDDNEANFTIDAEYVLGPIEIQLNVRSTFNVTCADECLTVKDITAIENRDYTTTLEVPEGHILPTEQNNVIVTVNNTRITNFAYERDSSDEKKATLTIPANEVTGSINIDPKLTFKVTVSNGITIPVEDKMARSGIKYETTLQVDEGYVLPNRDKLTVYVDNKPCSSFDYEIQGDSTAKFKILPQDVKGPIDIQLDRLYKVTFNAGIGYGDKVAQPNEKYQTILNVNDGVRLPKNENGVHVTINGQPSTNFDYLSEGDRTTATFTIDREYVKGPISVVVDYDYSVKLNADGVSLSQGTDYATPNSPYSTVLTPEDGKTLPASADDGVLVKIGEGSPNFSYSKNADGTATLTIDGKDVIGPISISLEVGQYCNINVTSYVKLTSGTEQAIKGQDYTTTFTVDDGVILPEKSDVKVYVNNTELSSFTYDIKSDNEATFSIGGSEVTGSIKIEVPCYTKVTVSEGITLSPDTASIYKAYEATLKTVDDEAVLPTTLKKVTVKGREILPGASGYTYTKTGNTGTISIKEGVINGPVNIELQYSYMYGAYVTSAYEEELTLTNSSVDPAKDFTTRISFSPDTYATKKMPEKGDLDIRISGVPLSGDKFTYNSSNATATLTINKTYLTGNVAIYLKNGLANKRWNEMSDWWNYCSNGVEGIQADINDVGTTVKATAYGASRDIKLIGIEADSWKDPHLGVYVKRHCTFEFYSVLPGAVEYDDEPLYNFMFLFSPLRTKLEVGKDCHFNNLQPSLQLQIKEVEKKVYCSINNVRNNHTIKNTTYNTRLFPLSHDEIYSHENGSSKHEGPKYKYYEDGHLPKKGCEHWLRSMYEVTGSIFDSDWLVDANGNSCHKMCQHSSGLAPAFCI